MGILALIILALGLSMDSFAVSLSSGVALKPFKISNVLKIALYLSFFQAVMPVIGWFLGNKLFPKEWFQPNMQEGKTGLMYLETPIINKEKLLLSLEVLSETHTLGIGTGRPYTEAKGALETFNISKYFDKTRFISHNYITNTEERLKEAGKPEVLTKPHPFVFLKGVFGDEISDDDILAGKYDKERCKRTLVIGDALCDLRAAFAGGCDFAAVLTGVQGKDAREVFEAEKATYILDDVLSLVCEV